ncbi:hypothetical protein E2C01_024602 [Portunus trituberculatus]|uniref:Carboxylesterase type B domain-containing protein n=1 Tax=Portunus trituberculatus TaxID=210409 RepID=A0A5B7EDL4_PORTR|nr:hypothetical protein [Portunus trituberculatus]
MMAAVSVMTLLLAPVEGVSWKGIRDGTIPPPPCPQLPSALDHSFINGEEDCLFLNVFTSKRRSIVSA